MRKDIAMAAAHAVPLASVQIPPRWLGRKAKALVPVDGSVRRAVLRELPGAWIRYYRGNLAFDRDEFTLLTPEARTYVDEVARQMWRLEQEGLVKLVQFRHSEGDYSYFAVTTEASRRVI